MRIPEPCAKCGHLRDHQDLCANCLRNALIDLVTAAEGVERLEPADPMSPWDNFKIGNLKIEVEEAKSILRQNEPYTDT